jgi:hypothetical protein
MRELLAPADCLIIGSCKKASILSADTTKDSSALWAPSALGIML